jgi:hypothetical protein
MTLKTTLNVHRPDYLKSHTDVYFFTSARQNGLALGINNFLFCYFVVTSDTLLSGPVPLCYSVPTVFLSMTQYSMLL